MVDVVDPQRYQYTAAAIAVLPRGKRVDGHFEVCQHSADIRDEGRPVDRNNLEAGFKALTHAVGQ